MSGHEDDMADIVRSMRGLPAKRTVRVHVDPKTIVDRNPLPDAAPCTGLRSPI